MSCNNNETKKSPMLLPKRKLSEPCGPKLEAETTLEETLNGLQKVSDMLQASLNDLEVTEINTPPIPPPRISSSPQCVRKLSEMSNSPQCGRKSSQDMDSLEMLRSNQPIVQLRTKLSEEMFGTSESTSSSTKQW